MEQINFSDFCKLLNASKWRGWIHETGLGVPFQYEFLNVAGASNTIISTSCLYDKNVQNISIRSVSEEGTTEFANRIYFSQRAYLPDDYADLFTLSISGAHKNTHEQSDSRSGGKSHAWIVLITTCKGIQQKWSVHVTFKAIGRKECGDCLVTISKDLMRCALRLDDYTIDDFIEQYAEDTKFMVDVIKNKDLSLEQKIKLLSESKPIFFRDGELIRAAEVLRDNNAIFRGSFNPPTKAHLAIGRDAIYEIGMGNARKDTADLQSLAHRVRMLTLLGKDVMITHSDKLFTLLHSRVLSLEYKKYKYLVGTDTFNSVTNIKWYSDLKENLSTSNANWKNAMRQFKSGIDNTGIFEVIQRADQRIEETQIEKFVEYVVTEIEYDHTISSTRVRNGELDLCPDVIANYIYALNLYNVQNHSAAASIV